MPCTITVKVIIIKFLFLNNYFFLLQSDRSYDIEIRVPPITYFLRQATGFSRLAMNPMEETSGILSLKHVYEIALVKSKDPLYDCVPLKKICEDIIEAAYRAGVKIVKHIDEEKYVKFVEERRNIVEQQLKELENIKQSKLLRAV